MRKLEVSILGLWPYLIAIVNPKRPDPTVIEASIRPAQRHRHTPSRNQKIIVAMFSSKETIRGFLARVRLAAF